MRVVVAEDRCRGHGACLAVCPDVFDLTDDGYAQTLKTDIGADEQDAVAEAARQCPEHAIETH